MSVTGPRRDPVGHVLADALENDPEGVVDARDARKITDAAVDAIARAKDPEKVFTANRKFLSAAATLSDGKTTTKRALDAYEAKGRDAVMARLAQTTGAAQLPIDARDAFVSELRDHGIVGERAAVKIEGVKGDAAGGFEFKWSAGAKKGDGFVLALKDGGHFTAPAKVAKKDLDAATAAFRKHFDESWAAQLKDDGATPAEVRKMRAEIVPSRLLFPGESDPNDLASTYPLVFVMNNPTGSDHGFYVGLDPRTGDSEAYDFN